MNVAKVDKADINEYSHIAIVTFDDEKTSIEKIVDSLEKAGFPIGSPPKFLK
jgi:copper chaperone CopZ